MRRKRGGYSGPLGGQLLSRRVRLGCVIRLTMMSVSKEALRSSGGVVNNAGPQLFEARDSVTAADDCLEKLPHFRKTSCENAVRYSV